jgi:uncharacterized protein YndB with AHSA1/START domain
LQVRNIKHELKFFMEKEPITVERLFNAPVLKVWKAISDKDEMKKWYLDLPAFKAEVGFEFEFYGGGTPEKQYLHKCKVMTVVPGKKLAYSWRFEGYRGDSLVTFELFEEEKGTRLKLTHEGIHTFPDTKEFSRENFEGWNYLVNIVLKDFLEKA